MQQSSWRHKDKLKPQPHDLNWKDIRNDKLVKFLIPMGATQIFKPHSNFKGGGGIQAPAFCKHYYWMARNFSISLRTK